MEPPEEEDNPWWNLFATEDVDVTAFYEWIFDEI